ncbi:phage head closure protein [Oricola thermophila]|uniref:Phage head closure protein n=1 Tax=Oricola thermophila TaxID=2742145 RepID=A0A6N1VDM9_9HYPH|nr:phage head closure protein [Oricola thermophila]QKV18633.1 phage head closure protein [Oricola thermophila]
MRGKHFDPGRLRHEMRLQRATRVPDALGGHAETWETVATLWARLEPAAGVVSRADGEEAEITHRVVLRADARVKRGMRLVEDGRILAIRAVRDLDETGRYLLCLTREETP